MNSGLDAAAPEAPQHRLAGWAIHCYTASGALIGLFTLKFIGEGRFRAAFAMMAVATVIDSSDGPLARGMHLKELIPEFDGALLDNIVDYLNYVVTPVFLMMRAGMLADDPWGIAAAGAVVLSSAFGFCRTDAKTQDNYFRGFPSYWNLVALYLFCFGTRPPFNAVIVLVLAAMVLTPIKFIYPNRTPRLRRLTLTLSFIWGVLIAAILVELPSPNPILVWLSFTFIGYYFVMSFVLHALR
jgi:phosphatidylcholine synthase